MNAINTYIDHMFRSLPSTPEARRAKTELRQMSEDRYHELRAEGVSEHEAVGRVITQFGNLDEVADELGIRSLVEDSDQHAAAFSDTEAARYVETRKRSSYMIAAGVGLILLGLAAHVALNPEMVKSGYDGNLGAQGALGIGVFFLAVAIAVGMFIVAGVSMSRFDLEDSQAIQLSPETTARYKQERSEYTSRYAMGIAAGVVIIILSVAVMAVMSFLLESGSFTGENVSVPGMIFMFVGIGIGVGILIVTLTRRSTLDRLTSSGEYKPELSSARTLTERIAGPYWMATIVIFLVWSFGWQAWQQSWIIWPIAGALFGLVAVTIEAVKSGDRKRESELS